MSDAGTGVAGISGTRIVIINSDGGIDAARSGGTRVIRTHVIVVTVERGTSLATAIAADFTTVTHRRVITRCSVIRMYASAGRVARIIRTAIVVITVRGSPAYARFIAAGVVGGTGVTVITRGGVGSIDAARDWVARIIRTHIPIVAIGRCSAHADPITAGVVGGAGVAVIARHGVRGMAGIAHATVLHGGFHIVGTDIPIVTERRTVSGTGTQLIAMREVVCDRRSINRDRIPVGGIIGREVANGGFGGSTGHRSAEDRQDGDE